MPEARPAAPRQAAALRPGKARLPAAAWLLLALAVPLCGQARRDADGRGAPPRGEAGPAVPAGAGYRVRRVYFIPPRFYVGDLVEMRLEIETPPGSQPQEGGIARGKEADGILAGAGASAPGTAPRCSPCRNRPAPCRPSSLISSPCGARGRRALW